MQGIDAAFYVGFFHRVAQPPDQPRHLGHVVVQQFVEHAQPPVAFQPLHVEQAVRRARLALAAGGRFTELVGPSAKNVIFVQTYSFFGDLSPVGQKVMAQLKAKYPDIKGPEDITPAVGVANAYDSVRVIAAAITKAGKTSGPAVRDGFYAIDKLDGLIKTYEKPFSKTQHDALTENDYIWTRFEGNHILPVASK